MKILFLSFTCEDIDVAMVTNINFDFFENRLQNRPRFTDFCTDFEEKKNGHCFAVYLEQKIYSIIVVISLPALYPSFITFLWQAFCDGHHFNCTILLFRK